MLHNLSKICSKTERIKASLLFFILLNKRVVQKKARFPPISCQIKCLYNKMVKGYFFTKSVEQDFPIKLLAKFSPFLNDNKCIYGYLLIFLRESKYLKRNS